MLFWLAPYLAKFWGPFRLFGSHMFLLSLGTLLGGLIVWLRLPKDWEKLPRDRGKILAGDGGKRSLGKPTGAGFCFSLHLLPVILLFAPLDFWGLGVVVCLYLNMLFGYWDDKSELPWGELKKGVLDMLVALATAFFLCKARPVEVWLPFIKGVWLAPLWVYLPVAALLLWFTTNATNCSDGVDGLAGALTLLSLFALAALLYGVVGYKPVATYLLIPHHPEAARWAILAATVAGGLAGYLWYNAEPSRVLMGDAGSRMLGLLVGVAVLVSGNPFLIVVVSPVVLVNGGTGLLKLVLLRMLRRVGFDVRHPDKLAPEERDDQHVIVQALHSIRFPLHDHCRKNLGWSNAQVLMRFMLLQAFLIPLLLVILVKIR